jgi:hypothetical protein
MDESATHNERLFPYIKQAKEEAEGFHGGNTSHPREVKKTRRAVKSKF